MKIRTQLILACLVLAILPLTGIVLYSYHSSKRALESAYHQEAQRLTQQMDRRIASIRAELDERLASLSSIEIPASRSASDRTAVVDNVLTAFGDAAPLIDAVEFIPAPPAPPSTTPKAKTATAAPSPAPAHPRVSVPAVPRVTAVIAAAAPQAHPEPGSHPTHMEPMIIDLPSVVIPRFETTPEAQKAMMDVAQVSADLERNATKMTREERDAKKELLRERSEVLEREVEASRTKFQEQMKLAIRQNEDRRKRIVLERERRAVERARAGEETLPVTPVPVNPEVVAPPPPVVVAGEVKIRRQGSPQEQEKLKQKERQAALLFGRRFNVPVEKEGEVVGQIRAKLSTDQVVHRILGASTDDRSELPFAIDREGNLYTRSEDDRRRLVSLGIPQRVQAGPSLRAIENWIVAMTRDEESGLRVGVARPVGENLIELKQTAARNFGYGLGLIAFALIGIVPLANHFTRDVQRVTAGAQRIAQGDLQTRLPVRGKDEFGQLALAFNRMAEDLSENQRRLVQQRVLAVEYERKSVELEDARRFQLSMLPKNVPKHDRYDVAVFTQTATEVGGDYYDFHVSEQGLLSITIGDATGHGAKAGTMVTVIKTLFSDYDGTEIPADFLGDAAEKIKRMDLGRMAMALLLARFEESRVTIA